ncbi:MAG: carbohydrate ABC transporter permease [Caldicoprobacterales bacterium]|jgi:putative aldouronate transport system permease protein
MKDRVGSNTLFYIVVYLIAIIGGIITLYPFLYIFSVSISDPQAVNRGEVYLWPIGLNFNSYKYVLRSKGIWMAYGNTIFYVVVGTICSIVATVMAAYPLSRKSFCARKFFNFFIVFCMYFSGGLIPTYLLITSMGFYNSRWVMIIPLLVASYYIMICRSAFASLPEEVIESAIVDGANDIQILLRIAVPLITPTLAVLVLYYAVGRWNNFFTPLLYISKQELQPLQVLLRRILIQSSQELLAEEILKSEDKGMVSLQVRYVTIVVSTLPIIMAYPFIQKYFVKGIMLGAVKG